MKRNKPIPECYWVGQQAQLLAGEYPGNLEEDVAQERLQQFLREGVSFFLDLTEEHELVPYADLLREETTKIGQDTEYRRMPIRDVSIPDPQHMRDILDTINAALQAQHTVYVHCWGGVGRTGTVIGCWLVRHGLSGDAALHELATLWRDVPKSYRKPCTPETAEQKGMVREWSEQ